MGQHAAGAACARTSPPDAARSLTAPDQANSAPTGWAASQGGCRVGREQQAAQRRGAALLQACALHPGPGRTVWLRAW